MADVRSDQIVINGAFTGQVVTGQQRYATELTARLPWASWLPGPTSASSKLRMFIWAQAVGLRGRRRTLLVSFTSRAPAFRRNHAVAVHDLFVIDHPEWYSRRYRWSHAFLLRLQLHRARTVFAVSEPVARQVSERYRNGATVPVVPNAPAHIFLAEPSDDDLAATLHKYGLKREGFVLAVGSIDPRKNAARLMRAWQNRQKELPLVFVGTASATFAPDVGRAGWDLGYVSDLELAHLYATAAVVAFPSLDEGFGLPAIEAMATGAAVVVSDNSVMRWVCGAHATYVNPLSEASIEEGIVQAVELKKTDLGLRKIRSNYVRAKFNWDTSAEVLSEILTANLRNSQ